MAVSYSREELGRGISLTRIYDKKFKSNCVKIAFISPLDEKQPASMQCYKQCL